MEKRLLLFLMLSLGIVTVYAMVQQAIAPPQIAENEDGAAEGEGGQGEDLPDPRWAELRGALPPLEEFPQAEAEAPQAIPETWQVLGAYDGTVGPIVVTTTSRGAGIERIEVVERTANGGLKYQELDEAGGYSGITALRRDEQGLLVGGVAPSSPAATAGIQAGDILTKAADEPLRLVEQWWSLLSRSHSGESLSLTYSRGGKEATADVVLDVSPLELIRPERDPEGLLTGNPPSMIVRLASVNGKELAPDDPLRIAMAERDWTPTTIADGSGVEYRFEIDEARLGNYGAAGSLTIVKRFRLSTDEARRHHLEFGLAFERSGPPLRLTYELDGPNSLTTEGWWYMTKIHPRMFHLAGARDVISRRGDGRRTLYGPSDIHSYARKHPKAPVLPFFNIEDPSERRTLSFLAMDTQYFTVALLPGEDAPTGGANGPSKTESAKTESAKTESAEDDAEAGAVPPGRLRFARAAPTMLDDVETTPRGRMKTVNTTFQVVSEELEVTESSAPLTFRLFAGPKRPELLREYSLEDCIEYGWFPYIARPLAAVLHLLYAIVRNYGLAIILLTVLVRFAMLPLGRKAAMNAAKMQELAPELNKLKEKYGKDMPKLMEAQRQLYKRHDFHPLSGCLPMMIQLPIFLALYRCFAVDIDLRQAPMLPGLSWCSNLAGPDKLLYWKGVLPGFLADETGWLGPYLNILPIATIVLFLVQQKMFTPPALNEEQRMQQKVMNFMMVFIGVMFFKVPAGLCLYFITSSLWGIGERKLLPKPKPGGAAASVPTPTPPAKRPKPKRR